jgi:hypothetical protein
MQLSTPVSNKLLAAIALPPVAILWLLFAILLLRSFSSLPETSAERREVATSHILGLRNALREEDAISKMQYIFPEGGCFVLTLYSLS